MLSPLGVKVQCWSNSNFMQNLQLAEVLKLCCNLKDQFTINLHIEKEKKMVKAFLVNIIM